MYVVGLTGDNNTAPTFPPLPPPLAAKTNAIFLTLNF